jgi:hypothetical protein
MIKKKASRKGQWDGWIVRFYFLLFLALTAWHANTHRLVHWRLSSIFFITGILNVLTGVIRSNQPTKNQIPYLIAIFMAPIALRKGDSCKILTTILRFRTIVHEVY